MFIAKVHVVFGDIEYETWAGAVGATFQKLVPRHDGTGTVDLYLIGSREVIDDFADELDYDPDGIRTQNAGVTDKRFCAKLFFGTEDFQKVG